MVLADKDLHPWHLSFFSFSLRFFSLHGFLFGGFADAKSFLMAFKTDAKNYASPTHLRKTVTGRTVGGGHKTSLHESIQYFQYFLLKLKNTRRLRLKKIASSSR